MVGTLAPRTGTFYESVRQEHILLLVVGLFDGFRVDVPVVPERPVYSLNELPVFLRVRAVEVVKCDAEGLEVGKLFRGNPGNQVFRRDAFLARPNHNRRAVGIGRTHVGAAMTAELLEAGPDIGLNVFHQMTHVNRAVGVWQRAADHDVALGIGH